MAQDVRLVTGDSLRLLRWLAVHEFGSWGDGPVDAILTDPPYQLSRPDMSKPDGRTLTRDYGEDMTEPLPVAELVTYFDRLLTRDGTVLVWCSDSQLGQWLSCLSNRFDKLMFGAWAKTNPAPNIRHRTWTSAAELWVWAARGKWTFNWPGHHGAYNVQVAPHVGGKRGEGTGHPNQKPLRICRPHVQVLTRPGDLILDPFAGSGSYLVAAKELGRRAVGFEVDPERAEAARRRLSTVSYQEALVAGER